MAFWRKLLPQLQTLTTPFPLLRHLHLLVPHPPKPPNHDPSPNLNSNFQPAVELHYRVEWLMQEGFFEEAFAHTLLGTFNSPRAPYYITPPHPLEQTSLLVLRELFNRRRYKDILSIHRVLIQLRFPIHDSISDFALAAYCLRGETDMALMYYSSSGRYSRATYGILTQFLVSSGNFDKALDISWDMEEMGIGVDPIVYFCLIHGCADAVRISCLCADLVKLSGQAENRGVVYGGLMKAYFLRGQEARAMHWYEVVMGGESVHMSSLAYNFVLDVLCKNGKFAEALKLFDRMKRKHTLDLGSYNVIANGYCMKGRFKEAADVFMGTDEMRCSPDASSFNHLIEKLCDNRLLAEAEELCERMGEKDVSPNEVTYSLLMEACFEAGRLDDAIAYFTEIIHDRNLMPTLSVYSRFVEECAKVGWQTESLPSRLLQKVRWFVPSYEMDTPMYELKLKVLCDTMKLNGALEMVSDILDYASVVLNSDMEKIIKEGLKKAGRFEEELEYLKKRAAIPSSLLERKVRGQQRKLVGRLGEAMVFRVLKAFHPSPIWVNEKKESGMAYDIMEGETYYYEVKASREPTDFFIMSQKEWDLAWEHWNVYKVVHIIVPGGQMKLHENFPNLFHNEKTLNLAYKISISD